MERLTQRLRTGEVLMASEYEEKYTEQEWISVLQDRLADYEDTGLTPELVRETAELAIWVHDNGIEKIKEWIKDDKDGRLVVLPCKVGDVIYGFHGERNILPMVAKWIETYDDRWAVAAQYTPMAPEFYMFSDFGKTVFLTREEAEKALEAME